MFARRGFFKKAIMFTAGGVGISKAKDRVRRTVNLPLHKGNSEYIFDECPNCSKAKAVNLGVKMVLHHHERIGCNGEKCKGCQYSKECKKNNGV